VVPEPHLARLAPLLPIRYSNVEAQKGCAVKLHVSKIHMENLSTCNSTTWLEFGWTWKELALT
jgi:hypothetical protein